MPALSKEDKLRLLTIVLESRHGDLREQNLNRQGKGHFHVSGMGHEGLAALGVAMVDGDYVVPYYRDRALVLGRGVASRELALDYFAKRKGQSHGRQMPSHYSYATRGIWSVPTPTGSQLLPACGIAWGIQLDNKPNVVVTTIGDAATRQGDFFEAVCFAKERKLPVLFVVEDNKYGISSPTRKINPRALDVLQPNDWQEIDGRDVQQIYDAGKKAFDSMRAGGGPAFFWVNMERLSSHTSSDDHKLYRSVEELAEGEKCDPLKFWSETLINEGIITAEDYAKLDQEIKERIRSEFAEAERAEDPSADELKLQVTGELPQLNDEVLPPGKYRIGDTINKTLRLGLQESGDRIIFGEDVEDPKGGVFRLTQKLSTEFPKQVYNSPLAESTILGVACGLASYGKRPVFELQFIDFIGPAWNQLVTNLSTLRWRSFGTWKCPAVIYAPYGAYLPGGSLWHSQANEAALAHYPGINVAIPSTPEDAAGLLWTAMHCEDPTFVLVPKHLLWAEHESQEPVRAVPLGVARKRNAGSDVTLVAWGNTVEKSLEALAEIGDEISVDLLDLRSIVPWDHDAIEESVARTGRLVVVQEDSENCSVGQMIVAHLAGLPEIWSELAAPPILVSKANVMIGYNPIYEYAALPDVKRIVGALHRAMSTAAEPRRAVAGLSDPSQRIETRPSMKKPAGINDPGYNQDMRAQKIVVPIMGEGIRNAKVVTMLKKPGDKIALDDPLCEVETDKAVYPIESSFAGTMGEWQTEVGATVDIGQELGTILTEGSASPAPEGAEVSAERNGDREQTEAAPRRLSRSMGIEPALSPTIIRKLGRVVPVNLQIDARWDAIRSARESSKKKEGKNAASPSLMVAWAIVRAMEKHAPFRRIILEDDRIEQHDEFDLGIAVALEDDRLATAVVTHANKRDWPDFVKRYNETVAETRAGRVDAMNAPLVISSLGAFGVRAAAPMVVPPSIATLFVGSAHYETIGDGKKSKAVEVITLSLTFDHRVVNGAGAANFVHDVKEQIENFSMPTGAKTR
ncbi:MAG TPA: thiamine pyrophosphate-dependent enzyme [Chthoniobacterales bacterium]|jgi:2-oxoisovalerate dehydrogenase E1 component|nr:thiamine pyrophosphate-dependent enzyme [Chthoniobacterales bacterium]